MPDPIQYLKEIIHTARSAKSVLQYHQKTKSSRVTVLQKKRYEIKQAAQRAIRSIDAEIKRTRENYTPPYHD
jgi:hypothetical protein